MVRSCIIGFGGIAQGHRAAYANLEKQGIAKLVGAYDIDPGQFTRKITINIDTGEQEKVDIHFYTDLEEMLEKEKPDMIDICVPSFLHADYAVQMLERGYHVQCEKPMALNYADCKRMLAAAEKSGKELMIGQILHFFWEYDYLKKAVDDGRFGKVLAASFSRLSSPPRWAWENWFMNYERSGAAEEPRRSRGHRDNRRPSAPKAEKVAVEAPKAEPVKETLPPDFPEGYTPPTKNKPQSREWC